jgi:hypothetical protein
MPGLQTQTVGWATGSVKAGAGLLAGVGLAAELEQLARAAAASAAALKAANRLMVPVDVTDV